MNKVSQAFSKLKFVLSNESFNLTIPLDKEPFEVMSVDAAIMQMRQLKDQRKAFFEKFDYEWAFDATTYENPLIALYQYYVLKIISDISPSHANFPKLGNIVVKFFPAASLVPQCRVCDGFKFVLIPNAFVKLLQECFWLMINLRTLPSPGRPTFLKTNHFFGAKVEASLRSNGKIASECIDRFIDVMAYYVNFSMPKMKPVSVYQKLIEKNIDKSIFADFGPLYETVEMFVICHEIAHFLEHDYESGERSVVKELHADEAACSLLFIHNSRELKHKFGFMLGPIIFYQLMRNIMMIRRTASALENKWQENDSGSCCGGNAPRRDKNDEELVLRLLNYGQYLKNFGLLSSASKIYDQLSHECYLVVAACQHRLLERLTGTPPSWTALLTPARQFERSELNKKFFI